MLERLIGRADIMIVNFPPPARERLRLRWEDVEPLNPRLVYCSLTGYGEQTRPRPTGLRRVGLFRPLGHPRCRALRGRTARPVAAGAGRRATAMTLVAAILMGLRQRDRTGKGCWVTPRSMPMAYGPTAPGGGRPGRRQVAAAPIARPATQCVDQPLPHQGRPLAAAPVGARRPAVGDVLQAIDRPDLLDDPRFGSRAERRERALELHKELAPVFAARTRRMGTALPAPASRSA